MSVPVLREARHNSSRWGTIRYALDSTPRTIRLCVILLVAGVSTALGSVAAVVLMHHVLMMLLPLH
jgi:hypothetical protein